MAIVYLSWETGIIDSSGAVHRRCAPMAGDGIQTSVPNKLAVLFVSTFVFSFPNNPQLTSFFFLLGKWGGKDIKIYGEGTMDGNGSVVIFDMDNIRTDLLTLPVGNAGGKNLPSSSTLRPCLSLPHHN